MTRFPLFLLLQYTAKMVLTEDSYDKAVSLIGTFLLQGWVLTDRNCPVADCPVSLLRSKDSVISFCVIHDNLPTVSSAGVSSADTRDTTQQIPASISSTVSELNQLSTDVKMDEKEITNMRREQSAKASQLIGQKLLEGWALTDEICPNSSCFGIPLLRDRTKKLFCVICEQNYMHESDYDPTKFHVVTDSQVAATAPLDLKNKLSQAKLTHSAPGSDSSQPKKRLKLAPELEPDSDTVMMKPNGTKHTINRHVIDTATSSSPLQQATTHAIEILAHKLDYLSLMIERAVDPKEIRELAETVVAVTEAARHLRNL